MLLYFFVSQHRYYGESQPLPGDAANATRQAFLSIEQALVDYVKLVQVG